MSSGKDPTLEPGRNVRSPLSVEEGVVGMCDELITAPVSHPPTLLWGGGRECWSEAESGKQGSVREGVLKIYCLILIVLL